jgi:dolichyl-phosphate-mannose-protein mannosyltransferase
MSSQRTPKPVRSYHLIALVLLAAFFAQCAWFVASVPLTQLEADQVLRGVTLLRHLPPATEPVSSPLVPLLSVAGIVFHLPHHPLLPDQFWLDQHRWFIRAPFLAAGLCLALSLWYIARRLYGNAGGHIALALFAFSPGMVACSSMAGPQIFAAWGALGLIFTAIATAHTLYAPREVIFWNWRRIILLGVSITFAVGAQWPLVWLLVPAAAFMLWAVPHRRRAALLILFASVTVALLLLDVCYFAGLRALVHGLAQAGWIRWEPQSLSLRLLGRILASFFLDAAPASLLAWVCAVAAWCASRRSRFFGNSAPLIVFLMLLAMSILFPENGASAILFAALPFLLLFIAGVFADLIESRFQAPALAFIFAVIAAQAAYSIAGLVRMYSRPLGS